MTDQEDIFNSGPPGFQNPFLDRGELMYPGAELEDVSSLNPDLVISRVSKIYFAYYGTYATDEESSTVTHHVQGRLAQSWDGTHRVRNIELLDNDRLSLFATLGDDTNVAGKNVLIWKRAP